MIVARPTIGQVGSRKTRGWGTDLGSTPDGSLYLELIAVGGGGLTRTDRQRPTTHVVDSTTPSGGLGGMVRRQGSDIRRQRAVLTRLVAALDRFLTPPGHTLCVDRCADVDDYRRIALMASTAGTQSSDHPPGRERTSSPAGELACSISWFRKYSWRDCCAAAARRRRTAWVSVGTSLICTLGIHPPSRRWCPQKSDSRVTRPDLVQQIAVDESGVQSKGSLEQGSPPRPPG